ncbi:MAG TPA: mannosyltransferase family protein [Ktedonobacteraceae bacterium]|nr:mannosyltransferase family protein [Ktedonobacteraceae bacterium]
MQEEKTLSMLNIEAQAPKAGKVNIQGQLKKQVAIEPWYKAFLATLPIFLITRAIFLVLTYFGVILFTLPNYSRQPLSFTVLVNRWSHWDVNWYNTIAIKGYVNPESAAFFPLFPLLERVVSLTLHRNVLYVGMLISNLAFLGTLILLYRFVETEFDSDTARRTALYLAVFPTALFFFAAYNESLFLFLVLLSFYAMRGGRWWLAGLSGALAALTRSIGLLLLFLFLYEFVRQVWPRIHSVWGEQQRWQMFKMLSGLPAALLIPLSLGLYAYYLNQRFHDPLALLHAQAHWREGLTVPWYAPFTAIRSILTLPPFTFITAHNIIAATALLLFLALLLLGFIGPERFAVSQWGILVFGLLTLLYPLFFPGTPDATGLIFDPLPSVQRFVLEIFPAFIVLARFGRHRWLHEGYLLLALPLLAFFVLQFLTGHWTI